MAQFNVSLRATKTANARAWRRASVSAVPESSIRDFVSFLARCLHAAPGLDQSMVVILPFVAFILILVGWRDDVGDSVELLLKILVFLL